MADGTGGKQNHTKHRRHQDGNEPQERKVLHHGIARLYHIGRAEDCCWSWSLAFTGKTEVGVQSRNVLCPSFDILITCSTSACPGTCGQWEITVIFLSDVQPMRMWVL